MDLSEKAETGLRLVREAPILSFDTETSGVDWKKNYPVGWVLSDPTVSVYVPTRHGGGGNLPDPDARPLSGPDAAPGTYPLHAYEVELAKAFKDRARLGLITVGHNLKFDCHMALNAGVELGRNLSCTQNNQALLNEYTRSFSLASVADEHGVTAKKSDEMYEHLARVLGVPNNRSAMSNFWRLPGTDPVAVSYAEGDGTTTGELYAAQRDKIAKEKLDQIWEVENELIWTLVRMERFGVKLDVEYIDEALKEIDAKVQAAREALPPDFNSRSPVQVQKYVEQFKTDWPTTEKGNPSFTEKWLKSFPEGRHIVNLRKWTNLANSFVLPLRDEHTFNGRVHADFNQNKADDFGTISGRLSCSRPNMQQVPKHNKETAPIIRRAFVADEGHLLYDADWSQAEPRLFAHYSEDKMLVEGYSSNPPKDVHTIVAEMLHKDRATTAKRMNMGIFTGMFPKSFAGHMGCSIDEATEMWNDWHALFPGVRPFQELAKQVIQSRGYVKTILGRRGRLENRRFAYRAVSKIIQGSQADMIKYKMVEIDKMLEQEEVARLQLQVHDSLVWQAPDTPAGKELSDDILRVMADVQGPPFNLKVPFVADYSIGKNWAEASGL
jgi:DNA polymerase I-like protein with 3'-5' exonuclease and polymerase domains